MPEKLNRIEKLPFWLKPLKDEQHYTPAQKQVIAFSIAFEGSVSITRTRQYYTATISLGNTEFDLLENFRRIVRLGKIGKATTQREGDKPYKIWKISNVHEIFYLLEQLKGYMPCEKYRKLRNLVSEFCKRRIVAHANGTLEAPYTQREHEIVKQVQKLNEKGTH